jgi:predicted dinucleotide-utilizing enzyme
MTLVSFQSGCDFFIGSPTAMADADTEAALRAAASGKGKGAGALYIPTGAMWGASDIQALANRGGLHALTITMKKHPASFRLPHAETDAKRAAACDSEGEHVLYEGSVRGLCPIAPNNVNTMACAAMAAHTLGFDGTVGRLVADTGLQTHEVEVLALGPPNPTSGAQLRIHVVRSSPAPPGAVTSKATYGSFLESLIKAHGRGPGVHFV